MEINISSQKKYPTTSKEAAVRVVEGSAPAKCTSVIVFKYECRDALCNVLRLERACLVFFLFCFCKLKEKKNPQSFLVQIVCLKGLVDILGNILFCFLDES